MGIWNKLLSCLIFLYRAFQSRGTLLAKAQFSFVFSQEVVTPGSQTGLQLRRPHITVDLPTQKHRRANRSLTKTPQTLVHLFQMFFVFRLDSWIRTSPGANTVL